MYYKRNNKRLSVSGRGDYMSTSDFIIQYYTNLDACRKFFYDIKWPTGYYCEKCGCTHYYFMKTKNCYRCANCKHDERLLSNTIFQDNKLSIPWWRSHPIHENRATESIWTEPCNPLLRATKSTKRATSTY
ncbi:MULTISPECIES: transposase [unclassified Holdemanella]|uniref:transposase n=1 Tax=unclassified Holdemanella TaxID=2633909 RepID=UPI001D0AB806|nr:MULTISPECIES: transposase [unclassified Holdemanella]MCB8641879.1 transposase [Holdemanella sp. DFI.5.55]MCG5650220.1 transposase [Holdemanella sp. DFI.5.21]